MIVEFLEPWINNSFDMKLNDVLYKTPEMTEERLKELIKSKDYRYFFKRSLIDRLNQLHKTDSFEDSVLKEWDLIQEKKSYLSRLERDKICGLVSLCLIEMTNGS